MTRPLMQKRVGELEALFANSKSEPEVLKQLEHELQHRQVPKAIALLADVQAALGNANSTERVTRLSVPHTPRIQLAAHTTNQLELGEHSTPILAPPVHEPTKVPRAFPLLPRLPEPTMPVSEAYKVLKVTPGSSWLAVEIERRSVVEQSNPVRLVALSHEARSKLLAAAQRANAAYASLWIERTGLNN